MPEALATDAMKRMSVALFQGDLKQLYSFDKSGDGSAVVKGIKVFKVGTFKDSSGMQFTWTAEHLQQMVFNYNLLRDKGHFVDVPWRVDHTRATDSVVGYVQNLYVEGDFLVADVNFTEPTAVDKMERGTYRGRSSEIGFFETNDEALYWPVFMGCAWVDRGAVEGLYSAADTVQRTIMMNKESNPDMKFEINGKEVTEAEWLAAATYAQALVDLNAVPKDNFDAVVTERDEAKTALSAAQAQVAAHTAGQTVAFQVFGATESDVTKVQTHITALEQFQAETKVANRNDFVAKLVNEKKLAATQVDSEKAFAQSLTDDQWAAYTARWDAAPESSLLGLHGAPPAGSPGTPIPSGNPVATEIENLEEIVAMHRRAGQTEEFIQATDSYKRLQTLQAQGK